MPQYLVKLLTHLPFDLAIPHLGICPKLQWQNIKRHLYIQGTHTALLTKKLETIQMPIN